MRAAKEGDADDVHALACELAAALGDGKPDAGDVRGRLRDLLEEPRARVVVVEQDGRVAGAVSLWIKPDLAHGDRVIEVPMLVVSENYRRAGVGRRLVKEVQRVAAENGASVIELVATRRNTAARNFYRSLGFVEADLVSLEFRGDMEDPPEPEG